MDLDLYLRKLYENELEKKKNILNNCYSKSKHKNIFSERIRNMIVRYYANVEDKVIVFKNFQSTLNEKICKVRIFISELFDKTDKYLFYINPHFNSNVKIIKISLINGIDQEKELGIEISKNHEIPSLFTGLYNKTQCYEIEFEDNDSNNNNIQIQFVTNCLEIDKVQWNTLVRKLVYQRLYNYNHVIFKSKSINTSFEKYLFISANSFATIVILNNESLEENIVKILIKKNESFKNKLISFVENINRHELKL